MIVLTSYSCLVILFPVPYQDLIKGLKMAISTKNQILIIYQ